MQIHIENDLSILENQVASFNFLSDSWASDLTSHRFHNLLNWFKCFSSCDGEAFSMTRGRNFIGTKCWLIKPEFFIIRNSNSIQAIVPLFLFKVFTRQDQKHYHMLSFCPDSSIFFYQDLLLEPAKRKSIIAAFFKFASQYIKEKNYFLYLGHIPENSPNIPYIKRGMATYLDHGYKGGSCFNYWRGGVYPWNISRMISILNRIRRKCDPSSQHLSREVDDAIDALNSQTKALLFFKKTQISLEHMLVELANKFIASPGMNALVSELSSTLVDKPIVYPFLKLPKDVETFLFNLSKSKRYYYRRYMKKFYSEGGEIENIDSREISEIDVTDFLNLHILRWGTESVAILKETLQFHKELCLSMSTDEQFRLFFAKYQGERIASVACFDINGRREFFYSGRSMNYSKLRAGKLLVHFTILDAIENNMSIFDFGYGDDGYKFDYTTSFQRLYSFLLACSGRMPELDHIFPVYEKINIGGLT